jgi:ABC-type transport system involved in multi-copper enzyme maturation permease subunit
MNAVWALSKLAIKEILRKKDFYVALILITVILFYASELKFYDVGHVARYLMEMGLSLIFLFSVILTVSLAARQYPSEVQNRTGLVLLAKPLSRAEFIAGKFAGSFLAGAACFLVFYVLFLVIARNSADPRSGAVVFQTFYVFLLNLMVAAAMASGLSYYLTTSANISVSIITYLLVDSYGPGLKEAFGAGRIFYYLLPHFEFFDLRQRFVHDWGPVSFKLLLFLSGYAFLYVILFLFLGWLGFRKKFL